MFIVKSPLRVSFFGGGTDIPKVYNEIKGCVFSATINKYIYININKKWPISETSVTAKYTILEEEVHARYLKHPIMRTVLVSEGINGVDISVSSDLPGGTGLGSSSAFTVGFLLAIKSLKGHSTSNYELASSACVIEMDQLKEPIGKQDAFAATFGGINRFDFHENGEVEIAESSLSENNGLRLQKSMYLVRVGGVRKTSDLLMQQLSELENQRRQITTYRKIAEQARWASSLQEFDEEEFGSALDEAWALKKSLSPNISNIEIEDLIILGKSCGATGAKLLGAGGSGFVLFIVPEKNRDKFISLMDNTKIIQPRVDKQGARIIYS
jgi:D-glycero-alpha-D-manno-heptose-7-phosphate kinase